MPKARSHVIVACALVEWALQQIAGEFSVVAIGDWGGQSDVEPTTFNQRVTGVGLSRVAMDINANFTIMVGDNFYKHGVYKDDMFSRFRDTFEAVYAKLLPDGHFYALAGNHDYGQGVLANVSAQVAYTKRSTQWRFPSLWYKINRDFEVDGKPRSLDLLVIDTVVLCGNGPHNEDIINEQLRFLGDEHLSIVGQTRRQAAAEVQFAWLEHELSTSNADFLWVAGHYPIWSAGMHGSSKCLIERLRPMLLSHAAHYIAGHDHMLEHVEHEGLNTFVVGAGMECCYAPVNIGQVPLGAMQYMLAGKNGATTRPQPPFPVLGGFASLRFGAESVAVSLHAHNGTVLYAPARIPRRQRAAERSSKPEVLSGVQGTAFVGGDDEEEKVLEVEEEEGEEEERMCKRRNKKKRRKRERRRVMRKMKMKKSKMRKRRMRDSREHEEEEEAEEKAEENKEARRRRKMYKRKSKRTRRRRRNKRRRKRKKKWK